MIKDKRNKVPVVMALTIVEYHIIYRIMVWIIDNFVGDSINILFVMRLIVIVVLPLLVTLGNIWLSEIMCKEKWLLKISDIWLLAYTMVVALMTVCGSILHYIRSETVSNIGAVSCEIIVISIIVAYRKSRKSRK